MAIHIKPSHKGLLHKELGVKAGSPIPAKKLEKAADSKSPAERKRAVFAENAKKWNKGGEKKEPNNPDGNPGYHPSTKGYEHMGAKHTSEDR